MTQPRYDVIAIGNAIVDVVAPCSDELIEEFGMVKGGMALIDADQARDLYDAMGPAREISGGSAANTLAGLSAMGAQCAFIGQVADDQLGQVFAHDIRAVGVDFDIAPRAGDPPTARCLVFVTPDGQRTMNTFLGASQFLPPAAVDAEVVGSGGILFLEGYMWDPAEPRAAMRVAIAAARAAGRKVALTLSDVFVIDRHGEDFRKLIEAGQIDILFANEAELAAITGETDFEAGVAMLAPLVPVLVATRSEKGAVALRDLGRGGERAEIAAEPDVEVVDTTGAGDLFAAGFLFGMIRGEGLERCLKRGAIAAAEVIGHYGARPETDLTRLMAAKLG